MKSTLLSAALLLSALSQQLSAFDPAVPPASSSLAQTVAHISNTKLPRVDYPDGLLPEVLEFIRGMEIPRKFGVILDASRLKLPESTRVKIVAKDITILQAAAMVAEQVQADLLIEPGRILLVPKSEKITK